jgi:hypothetical protein
MSLESPTAAKKRARQFAIIAELLTSAELGTSLIGTIPGGSSSDCAPRRLISSGVRASGC